MEKEIRLKKLIERLKNYINVTDYDIVFKESKVELWIIYKGNFNKIVDDIILENSFNYLDIFLIKE